MDHHHHYRLQNSWHPPPPPSPIAITMQQQGNNNSICPICSISHFPFCPPFYQNPNQPFIHNHNIHNNNNNNRFPQTPHYDPPPPPPYNNHHYPHPPIDNGFGDRNPWHRNPSFSSAHNDDESYASVEFKRMRHDDSASFTTANTYSNFVSEDERRLKLLIRDHGGVSVNSNGYMRANTVLQREIDGGERGRIGGFHLKPTSNVEMYEFQNPNIDYFENGRATLPKPPFSPLKFREEVGHQYELRRPHYAQSENDKIHSSGRDGNITHTTGRLSNIEQAQLIQDEEGPYRERGVQSNSRVPDDYLSVPPSLHYSLSQDHPEVYWNQSRQRIQESDSLSTNEPHYPHPTHWRGMERSMNEQRHNLPMIHQQIDNHMPHPYVVQHPLHPDHDTRQSIRANIFPEDEFSTPYGQQNLNKGGYPPMFIGANAAPTQASRVFDVYPPLPASPPPPLPVEPPVHPYNKPFASPSPPKTSSFLFPISVSSSTNVPSAYPSDVETHSSAQTNYADKPHHHIPVEGFEACQPLSEKYSREVHSFPLREVAPEKPKYIDASQIFKLPYRATRPDHIVIILRGLPGSGKSYLAKILRDLEVENGGDAPRIHSMDDYFMTEVEKVDNSEFSKCSGSIRGKKMVTKKVMEYCYEPEMEDAYRSSMLKAFKKTLDEGVFSFVIVDDRNLRVADFAQFWAIAKRTGFEVYLLESTYKDPAGCAARNVHGFTQYDIQKMAGQWEEAPSLYLKLDTKSLLHGDDLEESGIQEVDMDMEDEDPSGGLSGSETTHSQTLVAPIEDSESNGSPKDGIRRDAGGRPTEEVKELRKSKWSNDFGEGDAESTESSIRNSSALSGLITAYSKEGKSVCWGDKVANMGFSIGAARKPNGISLVIGPGAGYNLKSNPLVEQDNQPRDDKSVESKRQNLFQQQLRAERESFKAVFEKRKQRIGGFGTVEE